jgi:hypothetical protein
VFALEASRLARNNRDWHHLIDLCVLTDTLVIDGDGVYDPRQLNDRLVLGLKGTMSEFELGLLRQRAQEALRQKIGRGEVLTEVPVGYVRTELNGIEMTPDRQVQEAIRGVFIQFERLGSVRQVLLWYRQQSVPLCTYQRNAAGRQEGALGTTRLQPTVGDTAEPDLCRSLCLWPDDHTLAHGRRPCAQDSRARRSNGTMGSLDPGSSSRLHPMGAIRS